MPAPRPEIADLLEVDVPPGGKVITVSDLHLPPVRTDVSGRSCETLARHLDGETGPLTVVLAGDVVELLGFPEATATDILRAHEDLCAALTGGNRARRPGHLRDRQPRRRPGLGRQDGGRGAGDDRGQAVPVRGPDPGRRPQDPGGARSPARPVQLLPRPAQRAGHPDRPPHRPGGHPPDRVAGPGLGRRRARDGGPDRLPLVHRLPAGLPQAGPPAVVADRDPAGHPDPGPDTRVHLDPVPLPGHGRVGAPGRDPRLRRDRRPGRCWPSWSPSWPAGPGCRSARWPWTNGATGRTTPRASGPPTWSRTATTASSRATRTTRSWPPPRPASTPTPDRAPRSWRGSAGGSACPRRTCGTSRSAGWSSTARRPSWSRPGSSCRARPRWSGSSRGAATRTRTPRCASPPGRPAPTGPRRTRRPPARSPSSAIPRGSLSPRAPRGPRGPGRLYGPRDPRGPAGA